MGNEHEQTHNQPTAWTPRHEYAGRAMQAFISNIDCYIQLGQHLPTVAATSVIMADHMLAALGAEQESTTPVVPEVVSMRQMVTASGADEVLTNYEAVRSDMYHWQRRALAAEDELRLLRGETILAQPHDRRSRG